MSWGESVRVETPEQIDFDLEVAGPGSRLVAQLIDWLFKWLMLGGVVRLRNRGGRRLGDMAAGTVVIRERVTAAPEERLAWVVERAGSAFPFEREQLARCEPNDLHVLESFFGRISSLEGQARRKLAANLCDIFVKRTKYPLAEPLLGTEQAIEFLAALYRDLDA